MYSTTQSVARIPDRPRNTGSASRGGRRATENRPAHACTSRMWRPPDPELLVPCAQGQLGSIPSLGSTTDSFGSSGDSVMDNLTLKVEVTDVQGIVPLGQLPSSFPHRYSKSVWSCECRIKPSMARSSKTTMWVGIIRRQELDCVARRRRIHSPRSSLRAL